MDIFEISGFKSGIDDSGVNFLDPSDAFDVLRNGVIYRQEIKSRLGFSRFGSRLSGLKEDETRVMGIFENVVPDGEVELLVCSQKYLYKYQSGLNTFLQIVNNGSAPVNGFNIGNKTDYVSGTTYLTFEGAQRFVFCSSGMSDIFFYDGIDVKSFTTVADNPKYQAPAAGPLTRAKHVIFFGERLNFFVPQINSVTEHQSVLFSGIKNSDGDGDKFNTSGSGILAADTSENMQGALIFGDNMIMNFGRSSWVLEKTRDGFNPYFVRKIPSVLGTDAGFSPVNWNFEVKSVGKTGLITTDGRQSLRFDDLIPHFTTEEMSQKDFDLIYGGFDRFQAQFFWSYLDNGSDDTASTQDKVLVYNYEEKTWSINDQRFSVFGQTEQGQNLAWQDIEATADHPSWDRWDETEEIWRKIGILDDTQKTLAGDDLGFVYNINQDFDDYFENISGITNTTEAVLTIEPSAFQAGDEVFIKGVEGMLHDDTKSGINGRQVVISATITTVTFNLDTTNLTAYISGGTISKIIDFRAKLIPFNPYRAEGRKCYVSHLEFLLNTHTSPFFVDIFTDGESSLFKTVELTPSTTTTKTREWITVVVNQEAEFLNFLIRRESVSDQTVISAIRIHMSKGGLTAG